MIKVSLAKLRTVSSSRPAGYLSEVISRGKIDDNVLLLDPKVYQDLCRKYSPNRPKELPRKTKVKKEQSLIEWPLFLKPFKLMAKAGDRGLGDIVVRIIGEAESEAFQKWYLDTFGKSCGCKRREDYLNKRYPLS